MLLTSPKNPLLQSIRRSLSEGRPMDEGWLAMEGPHLVREVLSSDWPVEHIVVAQEATERHAGLLRALDGQRVIEVPRRIFVTITATEASQEILALVRPRAHTWEQVMSGSLLLILDGVQDPGNAGTMVRSAEAFGASGVVLLRDSVRVSNAKFLRATAGSLFRLPYLDNVEQAELLAHWPAARPVYALAPRGKLAIGEADFRGPCSLIVGSEAHGVSPSLLGRAIGVTIPTRQVESLNAAVAASIALFAAAQQRL